MYAIISKRSHRWFAGVDARCGNGSSHHILMGELPVLFPSEDLARVELLVHHLSPSAYHIVEVELSIKEQSFS